MNPSQGPIKEPYCSISPIELSPAFREKLEDVKFKPSIRSAGIHSTACMAFTDIKGFNRVLEGLFRVYGLGI